MGGDRVARRRRARRDLRLVAWPRFVRTPPPSRLGVAADRHLHAVQLPRISVADLSGKGRAARALAKQSRRHLAAPHLHPLLRERCAVLAGQPHFFRGETHLRRGHGSLQQPARARRRGCRARPHLDGPARRARHRHRAAALGRRIHDARLSVQRRPRRLRVFFHKKSRAFFSRLSGRVGVEEPAAGDPRHTARLPLRAARRVAADEFLAHEIFSRRRRLENFRSGANCFSTRRCRSSTFTHSSRCRSCSPRSSSRALRPV